MRTKYTPWEFRNILKIINPCIELLDEYTNQKTKLLCKCKKSGSLFKCLPEKLLDTFSGKKKNVAQNCEKCKGVNNNVISGKSIREGKRLVERIERIQSVAFGKYELVDDYVSEDEFITCKCVVCGNTWKSLPHKLTLLRSKCPKCDAGSNPTQNTKKRIKAFSLINSNSKYFNLHLADDLSIHCTCVKCGYQFVLTNYLKRERISCKKCNAIKREEKYDSLLKQGFTTVQRPRKEIEKKMADYFLVDTTTLFETHGHPECPAEIIYYTTKEFIAIVNKLSPNIEILDNEIRSSRKILCKCKKCQSTWNTWASRLLEGVSCPTCKGSCGEKLIAAYLEASKVDYVREYIFSDCTYKGFLRFDFYLPDYNAVIEFDGEQHFRPTDFSGKKSIAQVKEDFSYAQERDRIKNDYCNNNGIPMLRIRYNDKNIKQTIENFIHKIAN